jgi:hypothetical protein
MNGEMDGNARKMSLKTLLFLCWASHGMIILFHGNHQECQQIYFTVSEKIRMNVVILVAFVIHRN